MEKTVEIKSCKNCGAEFEITDKDLEFYDKVSPVFGGTKYSIPTPRHCPDCRQQKRLAWRNERKLYRRTCDATGKPIISMYSEDKPNKVYSQDIWRGDTLDSTNYGRDFNFDRPFFEQFLELIKEVPEFSLVNYLNENSDYANHTGWLKSCYLTFQSTYLQNCLYSSDMTRCNDIIDAIGTNDTSVGYQLIDCTGCYNLQYSSTSVNCKESKFLINCTNCSNCFACVGLVNKEYCILNQQYTKDEYKSKLIHYLQLGHEDIGKKIQELIIQGVPFKAYNIVGSDGSTGNNIINSKNIHSSFEVLDSENARYVQFVQNMVDGMDHTVGIGINLCYYNSVVGGNANNVNFSVNCFGDISNILYSKNCLAGSKNLFGCVGLKNKQYCILNKQYSKEEYEMLVPQIIEHMKKTGEWGEFFPEYLSPFGYNETVAMDYYSTTKEEALSKGYKWQDTEYHVNIPDGIQKVETKTLPNDISLVDDSILNKALLCEITGKPYRIVKTELDFYRKNKISLPKKHPEQRYYERFNLRNPRKLRKRTCMCENCTQNNQTNNPIEFLTTYSPDRPENVYCEVCYNKEVYG